MPWIFLLIGFALLSLAFVIWASLRRRSKIPLLQKAHLLEAWNAAQECSEPSQRVLEAEKVCDAVLRALDYSGTFAEKLQKAGPRLERLDDLWNAHRLRNRIAHEMNVRVSVTQAGNAIRAFESVIRKFLS